MSDRFVIQEHTRSGDTHWDLMLESGGCLKTWRLPMPPEKITTEPVEATRILDHPLKFLTYEGTVNKGQGTVTIADKGVCRLEQASDGIDLHLTGGQLKGHFQLRKLKGDNWQFQPL